MKKFISLALVLAMAFCFSVTAFAEGSMTTGSIADGSNVSVSETPIDSTENDVLETKKETAIADALAEIDSADSVEDARLIFFRNLEYDGVTPDDGIDIPFANMPANRTILAFIIDNGDMVFCGAFPVAEDGTVTVNVPHLTPLALYVIEPAAPTTSASASASTSYAKVCPVCGKTNVTLVNGQYQCGDCGHTWTEVGMTPAAGGPTSPKTGDAGVAAALVVAVIAGAGVCAFARKDEAC